MDDEQHNNNHTNNHPVKMFFSTSDIKENVLNKKDDASIAYIIMQNNQLHTNCDHLKEELMEIKFQKQELEEEVDSLSKTRTCLQGYVKNELELADNWKNVAKIYQRHLDSYFSAYLNAIIISTIISVTIGLIPMYQFRLTLLTLFIPTFLYYNMYELLTIKRKYTKDDSLIEFKNNIKTIEKNNIYILDLIDNI